MENEEEKGGAAYEDLVRSNRMLPLGLPPCKQFVQLYGHQGSLPVTAI